MVRTVLSRFRASFPGLAVISAWREDKSGGIPDPTKGTARGLLSLRQLHTPTTGVPRAIVVQYTRIDALRQTAGGLLRPPSGAAAVAGRCAPMRAGSRGPFPARAWPWSPWGSCGRDRSGSCRSPCWPPWMSKRAARSSTYCATAPAGSCRCRAASPARSRRDTQDIGPRPRGFVLHFSSLCPPSVYRIFSPTGWWPPAGRRGRPGCPRWSRSAC